jgi:methylated-DNA-[protein]-cysteine S-methyltransferase
MSEFQSRVLKLVSMVPPGKVTTYKKLALALGKPRAFRAVGNALAKNPTPVIIPCHRVVRSDGKIGGYKFGESQKAKLLSTEGVMIKNRKVNLQNFLTKLPKNPVSHCRKN